MASMAMTRSAIIILLAVALTGVQGRPYPEDFTFTNQPQIPTSRGFFRNPYTESTAHVDPQASANLDDSQFWASTQITQDAGRVTQPRGGLTNEYNYAMDGAKKRSDEFSTPEIDDYNEGQHAKFDREVQHHMMAEELARVKAFKEAQRANFDRDMHNYEAATSGKNEYPKVLPDGTEVLQVTGPQKATPEDLARLESLPGKPKSTAALPAAQRNAAQAGSTDVPVFSVDSSTWEDGPWGTKHRPGAAHSLEYLSFTQPDGTTVTVPQAFNNP